jgi:hypothetical protein
MEHFIYQRLHTVGGKALHLAEHLAIAARAFDHIYGFRPEPDERAVATRIAETLRAAHIPPRIGATVMLRLAPQDNYEFFAKQIITDGDPQVARSAGRKKSTEVITNASSTEPRQSSRSDGAGKGEGDNYEFTIEFERRLLDAGYALSALRPKAASYEYAIPFGAFPTNFQIEAQALFDTLALGGHGATRSVRREGDRLLSCGDAPLFAIKGHVLITPPLTEGAIESVERSLVIGAAASARLGVREEPILHSELKNYDELFFADAAGITSLAECDGAKFMSLTAPRLAAAMK